MGQNLLDLLTLKVNVIAMIVERNIKTDALGYLTP